MNLRIFFTVLISIKFNFVFAQENFLSAEDILTSEDSACSVVIGAEVAPPAYECSLCEDYINTRAKPSDRGDLYLRLSTEKCDLKSEPYPEKKKTGTSLYIDQDLLALDSWTGLNDDRNYTMGFGFAESGSIFSSGMIAEGRDWVDRLFNVFKVSHQTERLHSREYGVSAFTPNDLEEKQPIFGDRPYASIVYLSNSKTVAYHDGNAFKSRLTFALLGLDLAKVVQRFLHNDLDVSRQDPLGWDNQISQGGEPTILYSLEKVSYLNGLKSFDGFDWDLSYTQGANLGYYTDAYLGVDLRIGKITSPYYAHTANPLSVINHVNCYACQSGNNFFFASNRLRAVAYNAMLQGQFRDSKVTFSSAEIENVLHEASVGWTYQTSVNWNLTYALSFKSKEYRGPEERSHWFGGLYISKNFD
jgi:hypothetical protein